MANMKVMISWNVILCSWVDNEPGACIWKWYLSAELYVSHPRRLLSSFMNIVECETKNGHMEEVMQF